MPSSNLRAGLQRERPSSSSSKFGTIARECILLWAISARQNSSNLQDINRVHFFRGSPGRARPARMLRDPDRVLRDPDRVLRDPDKVLRDPDRVLRDPLTTGGD